MAIDITIKWQDVINAEQMPKEFAQIANELLSNQDKDFYAAAFLTMITSARGLTMENSDQSLSNLKASAEAVMAEEAHTTAKGMMEIIDTVMLNTTVNKKDVRVEVDSETLSYRLTVLEEPAASVSNILTNPAFNFPDAANK